MLWIPSILHASRGHTGWFSVILLSLAECLMILVYCKLIHILMGCRKLMHILYFPVLALVDWISSLFEFPCGQRELLAVVPHLPPPTLWRDNAFTWLRWNIHEKRWPMQFRDMLLVKLDHERCLMDYVKEWFMLDLPVLHVIFSLFIISYIWMRLERQFAMQFWFTLFNSYHWFCYILMVFACYRCCTSSMHNFISLKLVSI